MTPSTVRPTPQNAAAAPAAPTAIDIAREEHRLAGEVHEQRQAADIRASEEIAALDARKATNALTIHRLQTEMTEAILASGTVGERPRQAADLEAENNGIDRALTIARHRREDFKVHLERAGINAAHAETRLNLAEYRQAAREWGAHITAGLPILERVEHFARLSGTSIHVGTGWHINRRVPKVGNVNVGDPS